MMMGKYYNPLSVSFDHRPPITYSQTPVIFDRVVTNVGNAYDPVTGRFTAPINGTYQFNVVVSAQGRHKVIHTLDSSIQSISWQVAVWYSGYSTLVSIS